jgi:hypothetical protein
MRTSRILPVSVQPPSTSKSFLANGRVQYRTLYDDGSSVPQNPATVAAGRQQIRKWEMVYIYLNCIYVCLYIYIYIEDAISYSSRRLTVMSTCDDGPTGQQQQPLPFGR